MAERYGDEAADSILDFWCSDPPWVGCPGYVPDEAEQGNDYDGARARFEEITQDRGLSADSAVAEVARDFDPALAWRVAAFWCSPPAYAGCEGSRVGRAWEGFLFQIEIESVSPDSARASIAGLGEDLAQAIHDYWCTGRTCDALVTDGAPGLAAPGVDATGDIEDLFADLTEEMGYTADQARDSAAAVFGPVPAAAEAAYWCAPPPDAGCDGSRVADAWSRFREILGIDAGADSAAAAVAAEYDADLAAGLLDFWCSDPPGAGCPDANAQGVVEMVEYSGVSDEAWQFFERLIFDDSVTASDARDYLAERFSPAAADEILDYWCSPPPGAGCDADVASPEDAAAALFLSLVRDRGLTAAAARDTVTARHGAPYAEDLFSWWCSPPAGAGCAPTTPADCWSTLAASSPPGGALSAAQPTPAPQAATLRTAIQCTWNRAGTFAISAIVRSLENGEVLDVSARHQIAVVAPTVQTTAGGKTAKAPPPTATPAEGLDILQEPQTMLLALALLGLPLAMSLVVIPFRDGVTPSTIKPRFYTQCFYLTPVVLAIWLPVLLDHYSPDVSQVATLGTVSVLLIVLLLGWLLWVEVSYLINERSMTRLKAMGVWLMALVMAAPVAAVILSRDTIAGFFNITKFDLVEYVGIAVVGLLLLPFVVRITGLHRRNSSEPEGPHRFG